MSALALAFLLAADPYALAEQADRAEKSARHADAARLYAQLGELLPNHSGARLGQARALARAGQAREALSALARAAELGVGADLAGLDAAFGAASSSPEYQALRRRFEANVAPRARGEVAVRLAERDLFPESVAYDPAERAFYVGSMYRRKIVKVDPAGEVRDFVASAQDGLWTVLGMKVDPARRELWANTCNLGGGPPMSPPEPATVGRAAVVRYDLQTGRLLRKYEPPAGPDRLCFNDLDFAPGGDVYLSAGPNGIFRVDRARDALELFVPLAGYFVNGLAASADGQKLFLAEHVRGVQVLDVASRRVAPLALPTDATLSGIDGLYMYGSTLVAIQNALRHGPFRALQAFLDPALARVECVAVLDRNHPAYDVPTTGVVVGGALVYVATSQLDSFSADGRPFPLARLRENVLLRTPLRTRCEEPAAGVVDLEAERTELLRIHALDREAHFRTDVERLQAHAGDELIAVSRGRIDRVTRAAERELFRDSFRGATYLEWDDLQPPLVRVSGDGTMAWMIVRTRVRRTQRDVSGQDKAVSFVYAGIMTYEKRDGRWVRVANVSTFE
jgi:tetratricopeptide (TPR) repeat protein